MTAEIFTTFLASLKEKDLLQETKLGVLNEVLSGDTATRHLRPSLYDLLAHRVIDVFMNTQINNTYFIVKDSHLPDFTLAAMGIFQSLESYHTIPKNEPALAEVKLKKLKLIFQQENKNAAGYLKALEVLAAECRNTEIYADVLYEQALLYQNGQIKTDQPDSNQVRALAIAQKAIHAYPKSFAIRSLKNLIVQIKTSSLSLQMKAMNLPDKTAQLFFSYRNIDSVYILLYKIPSKNINAYFNQEKEYNQFVNANKVIKAGRSFYLLQPIINSIAF